MRVGKIVSARALNGAGDADTLRGERPSANTLTLRLPLQDLTLSPEVETDPEAVSRWGTRLLDNEPKVVLARLREALAQLNRGPLPWSNRFDLLERYLVPYGVVLGQRHAIDDAPELAQPRAQPRTLAADTRAEEDIGRGLAQEFAYGYNLVLQALVSGASRDQRQLAVVLQRALASLAHCVLHCYAGYQPVPTPVWAELAALYQFARGRSLASKAARAAQALSTFDASAEAIYLGLLTTARVDPYHLTRADLWRVHEYIGRHAGQLRLDPYTGDAEHDERAGVFVVYAHGYNRSDARTGDGAPIGQLNTRRLLASVQQRLAELPDDASERLYGTPAEVERRFIRRILDTLGLPSARGARREVESEVLTVTTGLATLHYLLRIGRAIPDPDPDAPTPLPGEETDFTRHTYGQDQWTQTDRGGGGVGLVRLMRPDQSIEVGALIGLARAEDGPLPAWDVGVLRWLSVSADGEYRTGVELVSHHPRAATLSVSDDAGHDDIALIVRSTDAERIEAILPRGRVGLGCKIRLSAEGLVGEFRVGRVIEALVHCDLVELNPH